MEKLIEGITEEVEAAKRLPYSPFRDVAIGAMHSAVHGLRTALENLEHHRMRMVATPSFLPAPKPSPKPSPLPSPTGEGRTAGMPSPLPSPTGEGIRAK